MQSLSNLGIALRCQGAASSILELARGAESASFESVWLVEVTEADDLALAGAISQATRKIKIATGVVNSNLRLPTLLAMGAATVADLSNGRFILGVGAGDPPMSFTTPLPQDKPLARLRETIQIVRLCLSGEIVNFQGQLYKVKDFRLPVKPRNRIPIFGAAMGSKMVENVAEVADGVLVMMPTLDHIKDVRRIISSVANRLSPNGVPSIACHLIVGVSENKDEAERLAKENVLDYLRIPVYRSNMIRLGFSEEVQFLEGFPLQKASWENVPTNMASSLIIYGTPEECTEKIKTFVDAGVTHPVVYPCNTLAGYPENIKRAIEMLAPVIRI